MDVLMFVLYTLIIAIIAAPTLVVIGSSLIDYWFKKVKETRAEALKNLAELARNAIDKSGQKVANE